MSMAIRTRTVRRRVVQVRADNVRRRDDHLSVEEPLEIRLVPAGQQGKPDAASPGHIPVAVTMRTPGNDFELAAGFLFTEGLLTEPGQIRAIGYCGDAAPGLPPVALRRPEERYNVVNVYLRAGVLVDVERLQRNFYTTSSCGICGKASLEAVEVMGVKPVQSDVRVTPDVLARLGDELREAQHVFERTGGLHAAGLFDANGRLIELREDVGRHNAVDKLLGHAFLEGETPLSESILLVSGRASFEIVQKAAVAGVPVVAAISAPSNLACDAAAAFHMTLVGFLRGERFNVYTGPERIEL